VWSVEGSIGTGVECGREHSDWCGVWKGGGCMYSDTHHFNGVGGSFLKTAAATTKRTMF
jgi:hypothetical protein